MNKPIRLRTVKDIIGLWASPAECAIAVGREAGKAVRPHQPRDWAIRGRIPSHFQYPVVRAVNRLGVVELSVELMLKIHARRPTPRKEAA